MTRDIKKQEMTKGEGSSNERGGYQRHQKRGWGIKRRRPLKTVGIKGEGPAKEKTSGERKTPKEKVDIKGKGVSKRGDTKREMGYQRRGGIKREGELKKNWVITVCFL